MKANVKVPKLGLQVSEVAILEWHVVEGASVAPGQDLVTIETEKTQATVPSPVGGVVTAIHVAAEEVAAVGQVVCTIVY